MRDLVETAGRDIRPQATVDEWLRQGVAELDAENRFRTVAHLFGQGGGGRLAATHGVPLLGQVPIDPAVRDAAERLLDDDDAHALISAIDAANGSARD